MVFSSLLVGALSRVRARSLALPLGANRVDVELNGSRDAIESNQSRVNPQKQHSSVGLRDTRGLLQVSNVQGSIAGHGCAVGAIPAAGTPARNYP